MKSTDGGWVDLGSDTGVARAGSAGSGRPGPRVDQLPWQGLSPTYVREAASERLKALAHPERLRIVEALAGEPKTVTELCSLLGRPMNVVSRNLRVLRDAQLVACSKRGNSVSYVLADKDVARLAAVAYRGAGGQVRKTLALSPQVRQAPSAGQTETT